MALTELEATVLGTLAALKPEAPQTLRQLLEVTRGEYAGATLRRVLRKLSKRGLVQRAESRPVRWRITERGRLAVGSPKYREQLLTKAVS